MLTVGNFCAPLCHHPVHEPLSIHVQVKGFTLWRKKNNGGRKKPGVIAQGQVDFALGQLKMEGQKLKLT